MALSDKKAAEDTALRREILDEGIDARGPGRYYPDEYSAQFQMIQYNDRAKAEIPKSLAGIVESYDDYKISSWADDEDVAIQKEGNEARLRVENYEKERQLSASLEIYDKTKQMQFELNQAEEQADRDGTSRQDAVAGVLENYANPDEFIDRPALQQMWQHTFQNNSLSTLANAQNTDYQNLHYKREASLQDLLYTGYADAISGKLTPEESYNKIIPSMINLTKDLPANVVQKYLDEGWNQIVLGKANNIIFQAQKGLITPDDATQALRELHNQYTQKTFKWTDANGNVLKNPDGTDKTFTATLSDSTQAQLFRIFNFSKSGHGAYDVGGAADDKLTGFMEDFETRIGWKEFEDTGFSSNLLEPDENGIPFNSVTFANWFGQKLQYVQNSGASNSKKADTLSKMLEEYAQVSTAINVADAIKAGSITNASVDLKDAVNVLEKDLASFHGNWKDYVLEVNGRRIGVAGILEDMPSLGSLNDAAHIYWQKALPQLKKMSDLVSNGSVGDLLVKVDRNTSLANISIVNGINASDLIRDNGGITGVNQTGVDKLVAGLQAYKRATTAVTKGYTSLPDSTIAGIFANLNDESKGFTDASKRLTATQAAVQALKKAGYISDVMRYNMRHPDKNNLSSDIATALCLENNGIDAKTKQGLRDVITLMSTDPKAVSMLPKQFSSTIAKDVDRLQLENDVYKELKIPASQQGWYRQVADATAMYVAKSKGNASVFKNTFRNLVASNYLPANSSNRLKESTFLYSPQMQPFEDASKPKGYDTTRLDEILSKTNRAMGIELGKLGLDTRWQNMAWISDDKTGTFRLAENGKPLMGQGPASLGPVLYYSSNLKNVSADSVAGVNAVSLAAELLATDSTARRNAMSKAGYNLTRTEMSVSSPSALKKLAGQYAPGAGSRKLGEVYYNQEYNLRKDAISLANTLNDREKIEKIMRYADSLRTDNNVVKGGAMQSVHIDSRILRALQGTAGVPGDIERTIKAVELERRNKRGGATGYASPITSNGASIYRDFISDSSDTDNESQGYTGTLPDLTNIKMLNYICGEATSASKVSQNDVSIPIAQAAIGNESYIDIYNSTQAAGFNITGAPVQGVVLDTSAMDGTATGGAANITGSEMYSGTQTTRPQTTSRKYSKEEINSLVDHYAGVFGIPKNLAKAMVRQESGGQQYVKSYKGASGIMQLMPETAKGLGVADPSDAAQNIWGGMRYLAAQYKTFGNWSSALAAYNAGPNAVKKYKGVPNYSETKRYVKNILSMAGMNSDTYPVQFAFSDKANNMRYIDADTGMLSVKGLTEFTNMLNTSSSYKSKVVQIKTNRPELLENKKEYEDYKQFRTMKTADGKPLFVKGSSIDGFEVMVKNDTNNLNGGLNVLANEAIADDMFNHQTGVLPKSNFESCHALLDTFSGRYNRKNYITLSTFGLADLSSEEYAEYGVPIEAQQNPVMQARVLAAEFQRAKDTLGSERKAVFALAGGKLVGNDGIIKSWAEIKKDKEAFYKQYFIKPSDDDKERNEINALVAMYNNTYNKYRGM